MKKKVTRKTRRMIASLLAAVMCVSLCTGFTANAQEAGGTSQQTESKEQSGQTGQSKEAELTGNDVPEGDAKKGTGTQEAAGVAAGTDSGKAGEADTVKDTAAGKNDAGVSETSGGQQNTQEEHEGNTEIQQMPKEAGEIEAAQEIAPLSVSGLSNPRIEKDSSMTAGQKVTWDCVWFGSYPQAEVVPSANDYTAIDKSMLKSGDIIQNSSLYSKLQSATGWNSNNDITVDGNKYRRMKKSDATYTGSTYNWSDSGTYHYFKYEPIKWRVLKVNGNQAFLLSDIALDDQKYNTEYESVTWETSTIRSWLNGYGASSNKQGKDYSNKNFIGSAFSSNEKSAIVNSSVVNDDNIYYGTEGGNNTTDKIFLLSESEVYGDSASLHGFVSSYSTDDEARRCKSSTYAKAMGTYSYSGSYNGNCWWWLRSPGDWTSGAADVDCSGCVLYNGGSVDLIDGGVRAALNLNLSSNLHTYAGTVSSDGKENEENKPADGGNTGGDTGEEEREETQSEKEFAQTHLDFINSADYKERMDTCWAEVISKGLDTTTGKIGEGMYNVLNSASEIISCKSLSVFENPYNAIIADLILSQTETQTKGYSLQYSSELSSYISMLENLCKMNSDKWEVSGGYKTSLEKLIESPSSVKESNPQFYQLCENLFSGFCDSGKLEGILNTYGKYSELTSALDKYANVVEWVAECIQYNALVSAYINTSAEFKASLTAALYYMQMDMDKDNYLSRSAYMNYFEQAVKQYNAFLTEDRIAGLLFEAYFKDGIKRVGDVFGSAIVKNVIVYFSEGIGISKAAAGWVYACLEAYKYGWKIGEAITDNGTSIDCREYARASYFLEDAFRWVVNDSAGTLKSKKNYQSAKNFDAAYSILQDLECYSLENYVRYLNAQQCSFAQGMFHGFNNEFNFAEIEITKISLIEWQNAGCHKTEKQAGQAEKISTAKICCPTDVFVYDKDSNLVLSVENNRVTRNTRGITASVVGELKILTIPEIENYKIDIRATDNGVMNYTVDTYRADNKSFIQSVNYLDIDVKKDEVYSGTGKSSELKKDGKNIKPTNSTTDIQAKTPVSDIRIKDAVSEMKAGDTLFLEAEVMPKDAYCPVLSWSSSDEKIATVDETGKVTAVGKGTVRIQCMAIDGSQVSAVKEINVSANELQGNTGGRVSKLTISGISKKIAAGKKVKLAVDITPSNAANKAVTWTSSNKKIATVNSAGVVTMKKKSGGKSVTITATAQDGSGVKATYKIKSMKGVVKKVAVSGKKTVKAGKTLKLKAKVTATKKANKKLKWTSSNKKYATVSSSGKVKALKAGKGKKVKITAMATDGSGKKKSVTIKIK